MALISLGGCHFGNFDNHRSLREVATTRQDGPRRQAEQFHKTEVKISTRASAEKRNIHIPTHNTPFVRV
jgi:hypothetical protein